MTSKDFLTICEACNVYKGMVSQPDANGEPGLNNRFTAKQMSSYIVKHFDEFEKFMTDRSFVEFESLNDLYEKENFLFIYYLQVFINEHSLEIDLMDSDDPLEVMFDDTVEVDPLTLEPVDEEKENKKQFIKEVMEGIEKKKTLKDFLDDPRSYEQFRDEVDHCLLYMDWSKIHAVMEALDWHWAYWIDEEWNEHHNETPSEYGIRFHVHEMIKSMEKWIREHPDADNYKSGTGGFEYEMCVCDPEDENDPDDFDHRVRLIVRFVAEQYDNGM